MSGRPWTPADVDDLERLYTMTHMTYTEIGSVLGRTKNSICGKAHQLGFEEDERPVGFVRSRGGRRGLSDEEKRASGMRLRDRKLRVGMHVRPYWRAVL